MIKRCVPNLPNSVCAECTSVALVPEVLILLYWSCKGRLAGHSKAPTLVLPCSWGTQTMHSLADGWGGIRAVQGGVL